MPENGPNLSFLDGWHPRGAYTKGPRPVAKNVRTIARWAERGEIRTMYVNGVACAHEDDIRKKVEGTIVERNPERVSV
jgi:hypothetical protein